MNLIYLALLCGLIATSFVSKSEARLQTESIVGGTASAVGRNTYVVSIQINDRHLCGGGILSNRHIITVAHFFIDQRNNRFLNADYMVIAGVNYAHNVHEPYRVKREVAKIYIPQEYNPIMTSNVPRTKTADIAVLELRANLGLNEFRTRVVLPPPAEPHPTYENQQAVVCGYGHNWVDMRRDPRTNRYVEVNTGSYSYEKRFAMVKIISNEACRNFARDIQDSHLCGHMVQRSRMHPEGLCTGDSGSPLVIANTIVGIVMRSPEGCRENVLPAIYTRVTSFIPFITNAVNGVREANMRLAQYVVGRDHIKVLVEQPFR